jgi:Spy/CpxP family protein refolding chaperone
MRFLFTAAVALIASTLAVAQQRERTADKPQESQMGGPPPLLVLSQKSVQEELSLNSEQLQKVSRAVQKQRKAAQELRGLQGEARDERIRELMQADHKAIKDILQPDQLKRFRQIMLQQIGAPAFANSRIVRELNLSDEQEEKIDEILDKAGRQMRGLVQGGPTDSARAKAEELDRHTTVQILELLTPEQKTKWKQLVGAPFKGEMQFQGRS